MTVPVDQPDWQNPQAGMAVLVHILDTTTFSNLGPTAVFDLSAYSTIAVWCPTSRTDGHLIRCFDQDTGQLITALTTPPDAGGNILNPVLIPIQRRAVYFDTDSAGNLEFHVWGVSRPESKIIRGFDDIDVDDLSLASGAVNAITVLGYGKGGGHTFAELGVSGATVTGAYQILSDAAVMTIADTGEMHNNPFGGRSIYKELITPRGVWILRFQPVTTGTAALNARLVYDR